MIADSSYRTIRRVQAARGLRGDLHEFVITARDTALLTSYVVRDADLSSVGGSRNGHDPGRDLPGDRPRRAARCCWSGTASSTSRWRSPTRRWARTGTSSTSTRSTSTATATCWCPSRSTHTVYKLDRSGAILWRLGGKRSDFAMGAGASFAWQHDARRQPDGTLTVFDNGATPAVERARAA